MVKLEGYSNLAKKQEDLLKVDYVFGKLFSFKFTTKIPSGLDFITRAGSAAKPGNLEFLGSSTFSYSQGDRKLCLKANRSNILRATVEYKPKDYVKDLNLKRMQKQMLLNKHLMELRVLNMFIRIESVLKTQLIVGQDGMGSGLDIGLNFATSSVTAYNATLFWFLKYQSIVLQHNTNKIALGQFNLSFCHKISVDTKFGANLLYPWNGTLQINFG